MIQIDVFFYLTLILVVHGLFSADLLSANISIFNKKLISTHHKHSFQPEKHISFDGSPHLFSTSWCYRRNQRKSEQKEKKRDYFKAKNERKGPKEQGRKCETCEREKEPKWRKVQSIVYNNFKSKIASNGRRFTRPFQEIWFWTSQLRRRQQSAIVFPKKSL